LAETKGFRGIVVPEAAPAARKLRWEISIPLPKFHDPWYYSSSYRTQESFLLEGDAVCKRICIYLLTIE
jgi:hypothetical protein